MNLFFSYRDGVVDAFPLFRASLTSGLSVVRPLKGPQDDASGWNYGSAPMPSYYAFGRLRAIVTLLEAERLRPRRVLEVAAGDGSLCASLRQRLGCEVVANDLREENLRTALRSFTNGAEIGVLPGNLFELDPAIAGTFDLVIACEVLEHVAHGVDFLRQLSRFVAPAGRILVTTPNGAHFRSNLPGYYDIADHTALESRQFQPDADGHLFLVKPAEMHRMAAEAGLAIEQLRLWGTPFVTGHAGARYLAPMLPIALCCALETRLASLAPSLCFNFIAVLRRSR